MAKKAKCNHIIGYTEERDGYDGTLTEFVSLDDLYLSKAKDLKSSNGSLFNFCFNCGKKLEGLFDKKVESLLAEKNQRDEEERLKKEKANELFNQKVLAESIKTKLNQLPEEGSFVVVFYPDKDSYGKNIVLTGSKDLILRNCIHIRQNRSNPDTLIVKSIYKVFSQEVFADILLKQGWNFVGTTKTLEITDGNKKKQLSLDSDGTIYVTEKPADLEKDDYGSNIYDRFTINRLGEYLKIDLDLDQFFIT